MQEASWTNPYEGGETSDTQSTTTTLTVATSARGSGVGGESEGGGPGALSHPEDAQTKWTEAIDEGSGTTYYYNVVTVCILRGTTVNRAKYC